MPSRPEASPPDVSERTPGTVTIRSERRVIRSDDRVLIIGAGPCGLACARELSRLGHQGWLIAERSSEAGGLASSVVDPQGFTWDLGGHVVFSHFGEFDDLLADVMKDDVYRHDRSSYVHFEDRWVPYPFQNNLRHLPPEVAYECLLGLIEAPGGDPSMDFASWMTAMFGPGITRHFMEPYNLKVWATPADRMAAHWIAERVSVVDYRRALHSLITGDDDLAWGPNNSFAFPASGGTGEIYRRLAATMSDRIEYDRRVVEIDPLARKVSFSDGSMESYDVLVSTMPLDLLVGHVAGAPDRVREAAGLLEHNGVYMVGVGYREPLADDRSWLYCPGAHSPFYRVTNFAKYSPNNVPDGDTSRFSSYMTETSYSPHKRVERSGLEERVMAGLVACGLVTEASTVASQHLVDIDYAYPVPTLRRDEGLAVIQPWLTEQRIYSRGRFGAWRYEHGNMDHAVKMGIDVARHLVRGIDEELYGT